MEGPLRNTPACLKVVSQASVIKTRAKALNAGTVHELSLCMMANCVGNNRLDSAGKVRLVSRVWCIHTLNVLGIYLQGQIKTKFVSN